MLTVIPLFFSLLGMLLPAPVGQQSQAIPRAQVRSPHGNLNMPCENCHTFTSWRPIRSMPEFNHDKTQVPAAWHAHERELHAVPHQPGVQQRGNALQGLSRRSASRTVWRRLRTVSYGSRLGRFAVKDSAPR